jgi:hypothetical protein
MPQPPDKVQLCKGSSPLEDAKRLSDLKIENDDIIGMCFVQAGTASSSVGWAHAATAATRRMSCRSSRAGQLQQQQQHSHEQAQLCHAPGLRTHLGSGMLDAGSQLQHAPAWLS